MIAKLKTGETITFPFDEMLAFIAENEHLIEKQSFSNPRPKRRLSSKAEKVAEYAMERRKERHKRN